MPVGSVSLTVSRFDSDPPLEATPGARVNVALLPASMCPPSLSEVAMERSGTAPTSVEAVSWLTSWYSLDPPVEAVHPKVSWYGMPVAGLIHEDGNVASAALFDVVGSAPESVCCVVVPSGV